MPTEAPSDEVDVRGHCYCGAITFRVQIPAGSQPLFTSYCHCDSCRRAHAAPLYHVAAIDEAWFEITAGEEHLEEFQKPGGRMVRAFCRVCGSKVLNRFPEWKPDGVVPLAFFPALLEEATQHALPTALRPKKHNRPGETVLDPEKLRELLDNW